MSRRSGQDGCIQKDGNWYVVRFWKDVAAQEKRQRVREKICLAFGPGKLSASERKRKAKEIIAASGADSVELFERVVRSNHGVTFREQAAIWLDQMLNRKRKPVAPATVETWESALDKWVNPNLGDMLLDTVNNLAMKQLVAKMVAGGLAPKSISNYTQIVKMVVASALNEQGEEIHQRKWNHEFVDLPMVKKHEQKRPTVTGEVVTEIVAATKREKYRMLFVLCAAAGLRIGEALGIDISNISTDCAIIKIKQKAWKSQLHNFLKTDNGEREIDLYPTVAAMLKAFIGERKSGLLFLSKSGKPLHQSNVLRRTLHPILKSLNHAKCGFHAFRRFRLTWLRENGVPRDLEHFWMGHADEEVGDLYSMLKAKVGFRKKEVERIGLGFAILARRPVVGPNGPKVEVAASEEVVVNC
jgi:integrase